eukprot:5548620-Amphidinium_carterae.1
MHPLPAHQVIPLLWQLCPHRSGLACSRQSALNHSQCCAVVMDCWFSKVIPLSVLCNSSGDQSQEEVTCGFWVECAMSIYKDAGHAVVYIGVQGSVLQHTIL